MATETKLVHIFGFSCYCFSSAFSFPLLRIPSPHYISQHIIGCWVCECVYLEPWDEECGYPLVWPGTQGHLTLSFSVKTKFHLKYNLTSDQLPSVSHGPVPFCCVLQKLFFFLVYQHLRGQLQTTFSERLDITPLTGLGFPSAEKHVPWEHLTSRLADQVDMASRSAIRMGFWTLLLSRWPSGF